MADYERSSAPLDTKVFLPGGEEEVDESPSDVDSDIIEDDLDRDLFKHKRYDQEYHDL